MPPYALFIERKLVAEKHRFDITDKELVPLEDARASFPTVDIACVRAEIVCTVPSWKTTSLPHHASTDATMDPTIPLFKMTCPACLTNDARGLHVEWKDSVDFRGLLRWSQCSACAIAFEVCDEPEFPDVGSFAEVPTRDEAVLAAQNEWATGSSFPCVCSVQVRVQGADNPVKLSNIGANDIVREVAKIVG